MGGSYIIPIPPHSGLTNLQGGVSGEYYHLTSSGYTFFQQLIGGTAEISATTFYSGTTDLSNLLNGNAGIPTLQAVTDNGEVTTNDIKLLGEVFGLKPEAKIIFQDTSFFSGSIPTQEYIGYDNDDFFGAVDGLKIQANNKLTIKYGLPNTGDTDVFSFNVVSRNNGSGTFGIGFINSAANANSKHINIGMYNPDTFALNRITNELIDQSVVQKLPNKNGTFAMLDDVLTGAGTLQSVTDTGNTTDNNIIMVTNPVETNEGIIRFSATTQQRHIKPFLGILNGTYGRDIGIYGASNINFVLDKVSGTTNGFTFQGSSTGNTYSPKMDIHLNYTEGESSGFTELRFINTSNLNSLTVDTSLLNGSTKTQKFPNKSGTIALTSDITGATLHTKTYVQQGTNITTGGTEDAPTINVVSNPVFNSLTATTFYSGTTSMNGLFANISNVIHDNVAGEFSAITDTDNIQLEDLLIIEKENEFYQKKKAPMSQIFEAMVISSAGSSGVAMLETGSGIPRKIKRMSGDTSRGIIVSDGMNRVQVGQVFDGENRIWYGSDGSGIPAATDLSVFSRTILSATTASQARINLGSNSVGNVGAVQLSHGNGTFSAETNSLLWDFSDNILSATNVHIDSVASFELYEGTIENSGTTELNCSNGSIQKYTVGHSSGTATLRYSNAKVGTYVFLFENLTTFSSYDVQLDSNFDWYTSSGSSINYNTTSGATNMMTAVYDGSNMYVTSIDTLEEV